MMSQSQLPVSALIKQGTMLNEGVSDKRKTKDEYRKQKDLEEQRKAGTAPAMVDVETGRDINPHIPEFIEKTPWYVPSGGPTLKHQRPHPERQKTLATINEWYPKGPSEKVAFKYREGACENCGAMGHKKKDCFERPRSIGAKFTNSEIAPDDHVLPKLNLGYDAKRDRWIGYDPTEFNQQAVFEYEKMEEARKVIRAEKIKDGLIEDGVEVDEDIYADDMALGQSVDMDSRTRITVRNLRIREDTAKYLYNLGENSAYYDPKSRSMRENPYENIPGKEKEAAKFAGENFVRYTGEVAEANEAQIFAWQARCKGIDVHSLAEPTRLEALKKEFEQQMKETKTSTKKDLLLKYGGEEHMDTLPRELLMSQNESYVEYNRRGKILKGIEKAFIKSRYDEDIYINNHVSVFGSYWKSGQWGYKCCHSFIKQSYCLGEQGKHLEKSLFQQNVDVQVNETQESFTSIVSTSHNQEANVKKDDFQDASHESDDSNRNSSESESTDDEERELLKKQLEAEIEKKQRDENKRKARKEKRRKQKERRKETRNETKKLEKRPRLENLSSESSESDSS